MSKAAEAAVSIDEKLASLPMQVSNRVLLVILAIVPAAALIAVIDQIFLNDSIMNGMISDPGKIAYWTAILTTPHIVASLITFADREYLFHYRRHLVKGGLISLGLGFGVPIITGLAISLAYGLAMPDIETVAIQGGAGTLIVIAFYTMYHNLMQQYGISLMMMRHGPTLDFQIWRWMTIIPAGLAFMLLMSSGLPFIKPFLAPLFLGIGIALAFATIFAVRFLRTAMKNPQTTKIGFVYFLSNMAMLYVTYALIVVGYGFLATLVPRLVHDLTAFWIYMVHDQNRNADKVRNPVYALPKKIGVQPVVLCVPLSLAISYVLMEGMNSLFWASMFVISLNFMHYYMEGYMWKRGTPHRRHVPFV